MRDEHKSTSEIAIVLAVKSMQDKLGPYGLDPYPLVFG